MLSIFWGGGRRGKSQNLREKGKTFQKIGGKGQNTYTKKKITCKKLGLGGHMVYVLNNAFA